MEIFKQLEDLINKTKYIKTDYKLEKTKENFKLFGSPQNKFKSIHVAGSKGKGSVSTVLANIISDNGYKTGLYTSPHIQSYHERMNLVKRNINPVFLKNNFEIIKNKINNGVFKPFSFFEILTLFAFLCFADEKVDLVVVEAGIGGRNDTTNIINSFASIICQIELEHTDILGDSIEKIAFEKAGIIKNSHKVFLLNQDKKVTNIIKNQAKKTDASLDIINPKERLISFNKDSFYFFLNKDKHFVKTKNPSKSYFYNYIFACKIASILGYKTCNLKTVFLKARFEIRKYKGLEIVLDMAHTPKSIKNTINNFFSFYDNGVIIFSFVKSKQTNYSFMLDDIFSNFQTAIQTSINEYKKSDDKDLLEKSKKIKKDIIYEKDNLKALDIACSHNLPILICGSSYLISSYYKHLNIHL